MQVEWDSKTIKFGECIGFATYADIPGITKIHFLGAASIAGFDLEQMADLQELSFPNLVSIDPLNTQGGFFYCSDSPSLTTVDFSSLTTIGGYFYCADNDSLITVDLSSLTIDGGYLNCSSNASLTTLNLSALTTIGGNFRCSNSPSLTTVDISAITSLSGNVYCSNCALNAASMENILHALVGLGAGYTGKTINLDGGTNAGLSSLSVQGQADYATLVARPNTVTINA